MLDKDFINSALDELSEGTYEVIQEFYDDNEGMTIDEYTKSHSVHISYDMAVKIGSFLSMCLFRDEQSNN